MSILAASTAEMMKQAPRVLIVDDDSAMQRLICEHLSHHNLRTSVASDQRTMFQAISSRRPDLIILDMHLGAEDGLDLLRELRTQSVVPVILITGHRQDEVDQIVGLELGADDYIKKPFNPRELVARTRALLRRRAMDRLHPLRHEEQRYGFQGWVFDQLGRMLTSPSGATVVLTKSEFALLSAFVQSPRRPLSREHLLQATRMHEDVYDRSIDVQILRLRRKLENDPSKPRLIRTERGVGYLFDADVHVG